MALKWVAVNPKDGAPICEFKSAVLKSSMSGFIGQGEGVQIALPVADRLPSKWELATERMRTLIVCHYDNAEQTVLWVGTVSKRSWGSGPFIELSLMSMEEWLDGQYIVKSFKNVEQSIIARDSGLSYISSFCNGGGAVEVVNTGIARTRTFNVDDDITMLNALQNIMSVVDGPEWVIRWKWNGNGRLVCSPFVGPRVGRSGVQYTITRAEWTRSQDFTKGKGANIVTAVENKQGAKRNMVTRKSDDLLDAGYLPFEFRWQPEVGSLKESADLAPYAERRLEEMELGTQSLVAKVHIDDFIVGTSKLQLGDDISLDLDNPNLPDLGERSVQRLVGWTLEADQHSGEPTYFTPITLGVNQDIVTDDSINSDHSLEGSIHESAPKATTARKRSTTTKTTYKDANGVYHTVTNTVTNLG